MPDEMTTETIASEPAPESIADETKPESIADDAPSGDDEKKDEPKDAPKDEGKKEEEKPADWELAAPEDFPLPEENLKSFVEVAKKLGLSKEQAEGMLGWHKDFNQAAQDFAKQEQARIVGAWDKEIMQDKDFGGANLKGTIADARKALGQFDPDGSLRAMLRQTGYDRNPAIIRVVARVGKAMGEHDFIGGNGGGKTKTPLEERIYANWDVKA